ncbi:hypothetical protein C2G38_2093129 [Gigaspora rosea]|uniref:Protein kinase domain-containing protein n=1 Tax=Gigaspora rosea TaxID=44941 RepID=A0A397UZ91_9GLOM|nr:hypothetical protein C2G38_2093129 [Gigaspora rosea]
MSGKRKFFYADNILAIYIPVIDAVKLLVQEIYQIYENAECNKQLCAVMVDRVKAAEYFIGKIVRSIEKKKEDFNKKSYYLAFERFKNILTNIKEYCKNVSKLKGYKRFLNAADVKNKFEQLRDDFDRCMNDLNFAFDVSNAVDREEGSQRVDKSLEEIIESLQQLDDKLNEDVKKIGTNELDDPKKPIIRGRVFKKMYKSLIEVACKPIDGQNKNEMAVLSKLVINNSQVMIIEWAELGNLKELYEKYDIPWTRKIQIANDILLGLQFLRTSNVFHHEIMCENVFVLRDLSVKLGNFGFARKVDSNSRNFSSLTTYIVRWMAPELIKKYISQSHDENKRIYTFNCEMFSFGMLLWELCYEKLPYAEWNIEQISDHVLSGKRESILKGKFANCDDREIQLEFIKIIQDGKGFEELTNKFPIHLDEPPLLTEGELDLDGLKSGVLEISDIPEIEEEVPKEIEEITVISLKDGIDMHIKKEYKRAWEFFKQNDELNDPLAKFWVGYYLFYGLHGEKDPTQARKYFKEAADENNHAKLQYRYAVLLLNDLGKETDDAAKNQLRKEIIRYFELAANNPENRNVDAMYYLGDIYVAGKLKVKKDEERGLNYLRLAANGNNERAIALLKMLGIGVDEYKEFINHQISAENGDSNGICDIGRCYQYGIGTRKDEHKAFIYYQKSAEMGNAMGTCNVGYCYQNGIGIEKDEHKAFIYYQKSADMGDAYGDYNVGNCYNEGIGIEKDEHKAFLCYKKSAEMKNASGIFALGNCYKDGIGVEKNEYRAFIYYQKSAEMGHIDGTYNVGNCYQNGTGVEKNENKAFTYYQKSADMGHAYGAYNVGSFYQNGIGVEKNEHKAFIYYQKSADMGHANGAYFVGYFCQNGVGVEKDEPKAFNYYRKSAEMGHAIGAYNAGYCYQNGIGVTMNEQEAFLYYQKSYEIGDAEGTYMVGYCYQNGIGVVGNEHNASNYYQISAEMGNVNALGACYENGFGVEKDEYNAFNYYQKSADMENANGTYKVGCCYQHGIGVEKDEQKAFVYYQKSTEMGHAGGIYNVGYCFQNGIGVETDEYKAFMYYQKSSDIGDVKGTYKVGYCYEEGIGVEKNEDKAFTYYNKLDEIGYFYHYGIEDEKDAFNYYMKSNEGGRAEGAYNTGRCYLDGKGVEKDEKKAFENFKKSAVMGHAGGNLQVGDCYRNGIGVPRDIHRANHWYRRERGVKRINRLPYENLDDNLKNILDEEKYQLSWIPYNKFEIELVPV